MRKHFWGMNLEDWHDVQQDVWHKLSVNIVLVQTLSPSEQFKWLTNVCHNQVISLFRKQSKVVEQDNESMELILEAKQKSNLEDEVVNKMMLEELLKKLPKEDREFLLKMEFSKDKNKRKRDNADACRIYRIKQKLRKLWKEGGWDD